MQKAALPLKEQHLETDPIKLKAPVRPSEQCKPDASSPKEQPAGNDQNPSHGAELVEHRP